MKSISWILLISMIFYCCTATHMIKHDQSAYDELNRKVEGEKAKITLMNDDVIVGENIFMEVDSTSWVEVEKRKTYSLFRKRHEFDEKWSVPTLDIKKIDVGGNSGQGALGGLYYGFLIGASLGAIFGLILIAGTDSDQSIGGGAVLFTSALGGIAGAIVGLPLGLLAGGTDEYVLTDSTHFSESD